MNKTTLLFVVGTMYIAIAAIGLGLGWDRNNRYQDAISVCQKMLDDAWEQHIDGCPSPNNTKECKYKNNFIWAAAMHEIERCYNNVEIGYHH